MGLALSVDSVRWSFERGQRFLEVEDLSVEAGQMAAVVGPSGAGKSTFLFLLAGLEVPESGRLLWGSHNMAAQPPRARDRWRSRTMGLVFQDFQLVPELTALENVLLPITFEQFRVTRDQRTRAAALLEQMGVTRVDARARTLSRGELQRTALARALFRRPEVLLADEPTASLDAENEAAVAALLLDYCRQNGATVLVSTHQAALREAADRRIRVEHGVVTAEAS